MKFIKVAAIVVAGLVLGIISLGFWAALSAPVTTSAVDPAPTQAQAAQDQISEPPTTTVEDWAPEYTGAQENAISKAEDYLAFTYFSKPGLRAQLEYEGFAPADAKFAVNHIEVDWTDQAEGKAADYLEYTAFSCESLITQLEWEQFTPKQAHAGAHSTKACDE